ncbi:MAG: cysteine desulfurase [bacterium]|nr:cysteine desulfurase [bacterium]
MLDIQKIRKDFPQLDKPNYHYLDAAASSLTPTVVLDAVADYYHNYRANVHRALFKEAVTATEKYEEARKKVAKFIGANSTEEVIFTSGATESSNMLVRMLEESSAFSTWKPDVQVERRVNIVTTEMEHHSALVPLQQLVKRAKLELKYISLKNFGLDYGVAEKLITKDTALVSVMLASNVVGTVNDVRGIADIAHAHGAIVVCDATAAVGHIPVDVKALGADALYFSGHKMLGPTGVGVLWVKGTLLEKLEPSSFGGHMISSVSKESAEWAPPPERFEAGTKNIGGVIGLGAAISYLENLGVEKIHEHVRELTAYAIAKLEQIHGVRVLAEHDTAKNIGAVSFVCDFAHPHDVAEILARDNVAVRPGHHCAMPLHTALGVNATTRASFHVYNTKEDIDALIEGVLKAKNIFS